jgi:hypothetical protein
MSWTVMLPKTVILKPFRKMSRRPFLRDDVHRAIVVLGRLVTTHKRIDHNNIDLSRDDSRGETVHHRSNDNGPVARRGGNNQPLIAAAVDEKPMAITNKFAMRLSYEPRVSAFIA